MHVGMTGASEGWREGIYIREGGMERCRDGGMEWCSGVVMEGLRG